jgi:hypothetical protein
MVDIRRQNIDLPQPDQDASQIPARRGVLAQALDLVAPGGDGERKVGPAYKDAMPTFESTP